MQLAKGEFGGRVGIWRLLELFASHGIHATIFTPGRICAPSARAVITPRRFSSSWAISTPRLKPLIICPIISPTRSIRTRC
jgi:peptidoglycan/xylan/chitin deacetylase (PgdA/CDA1 family)